MGFGRADELPFGDGTHAVIWQAKAGDTPGVKRAIEAAGGKRERWAAVNSRNEDDDDQSALHVAASRGYLPMAKLLLDAGAELSRTIRARPCFTSPRRTTTRTWSPCS